MIVLFLALTLRLSPHLPAHLLQKATMTTSPPKIILSKLLNHKILELLSSHYPVFIFIFQFPNLTSTSVKGSMFFFIPHSSWYNDQRKHLIILFVNIIICIKIILFFYIINHFICIICLFSSSGVQYFDGAAKSKDMRNTGNLG